jgi:hypothetical protein
MNARLAGFVCAFGALLVAVAAPAAAQNSPKWEIEFHAGGLLSNNPGDGTSSLPPAGAPFATQGGRPSRRVSTWYFGDGASLLNDIMAAFPSRPSQRITPLDAVINAPLATREDGFAFGFRVSRSINSRFTAEATVDYSPARFELTRETERGVEATRGTFESTFNGLLATAPISGQTVTSTSTFDNGSGGQLFTTGTLNVALKTSGSVIPYVTGGAGVISNLGDQPGATLEGHYRFQLVGTFPMSETDLVRLRVSVPDKVFVGVVGAGAKYVASPRWGMRVDGRVYLGSGKVETVVDATPSVSSTPPIATLALSSASTPAIQFSNNPRGTGPQSNLTGEPVAGFTTFEGSGLRTQFTLTAGLFLRF